MNKFHILVVALFGFLLMPSNSFACGTKTEKSCCKKETTSKTEKKDCCNNKQHSKDKDNSCGGKCGHSNCTSSTTVNFSIISSYEINFKNNLLFCCTNVFFIIFVPIIIISATNKPKVTLFIAKNINNMSR